MSGWTDDGWESKVGAVLEERRAFQHRVESRPAEYDYEKVKEADRGLLWRAIRGCLTDGGWLDMPHGPERLVQIDAELSLKQLKRLAELIEQWPNE